MSEPACVPGLDGRRHASRPRPKAFGRLSSSTRGEGARDPTLIRAATGGVTTARAILIAVVALGTFGSSARPARAQTAPVSDCFEESIRGEIDPRGERIGIEKRDFIKAGRVELTALGGYVGSDLYSSSYLYGGALAYHLFEGLAIEGNFHVQRADANLQTLSKITQGVTTFVGERTMEAGGAFLWSPIHAKLKAGRSSIAHFDIYLALGAGINLGTNSRGAVYSAGAGTKVFLNRWLAFRFDVRDHIGQQELLGETHLVNNVAVTFGFSAFIPFKG